MRVARMMAAALAMTSVGASISPMAQADVVVTRIHDVQGPGSSSPIVGATVTVEAVVTGVASNGFFLQEPDATVDADPATSEGIFVFTNGAPPSAAQVGNMVRVTANVSEFMPALDPLSLTVTELTVPTMTLISTGNPLPTAVALTATFPDPAGPHDQLERVEGMRVSAASLTVTGATLGSASETNATSTSTGVFHGVVTGNARPFVEAGIRSPDPAPSGSIPPIPRWDANPEVVRVDSDGLTGASALDVGAGAVVTGLVGPLTYASRNYTILPEPSSPPSVAGGPVTTSVTAPTADEFTVATLSAGRLFDTENDPTIGEPVLTAAAFDRRLTKLSLAVRDHMRMPDIVALTEVENLATLQALASRISSDAIANSQPDPLYAPYLVEGNDLGGIDVAFLVKTASVGADSRVAVQNVAQHGDGLLLGNPDTTASTLFDRPPLSLTADVNFADGRSFPITVLNVHLQSMNGIDDADPGSNGWATAGDRVRAKRQMQAEIVANVVQSWQTDPTRHIVVVGDTNAHGFNNGYDDIDGTLRGQPAPDNQTVVPGDGFDLVHPDLTDLLGTMPADQRYTTTIGGNAASLLHAYANGALLDDTTAARMETARISADFPAVSLNDSTAVRSSAYDPQVSYFELAPVADNADISVTASDSPDPVLPGGSVIYTITVMNAGPDASGATTMVASLPTEIGFSSLTAPGGWSCTTPAVGANGSVSCNVNTMSAVTAVFTLVGTVDPATTPGTLLSLDIDANGTAVDPDESDNGITVETTVTPSADLSIAAVDSPDPVAPGADLTYTITLTNSGPSSATAGEMTTEVPGSTTFVSLTAPSGWTCTTPAVGGIGPITCTTATVALGSYEFTLVVAVRTDEVGGTVLYLPAAAATSTSDPDGDNDSIVAETDVETLADLSITVTSAPDPVVAGTNLVTTVEVENSGPEDAANAHWSLTLPAGTLFVSMNSPAGWNCTTPAVGTGGPVDCTIASLADGASASFTLTTVVVSHHPAGSTLTTEVTVSSDATDPNGGNNSGSETVTVTAVADLDVTITGTPDPVVPGGQVTYVIVIVNSGPSQATNASFIDQLPLGTRFVSLTGPIGSVTGLAGSPLWTCTTPAVGSGGTVTCSNLAFANGASATFTLVVSVDSNVPNGTNITNTVTVASNASDPVPSNGTANDSATVTRRSIPATGTAADGWLSGGIALLVAGGCLSAMGRRRRHT